jgi:hypothetical protein
VASLAKRWLLGTHQGSVSPAHLPAYRDECGFRFNRRRSASRGMVFYRVLELASGHDPVRFHDLLAGKKPRPAPHARGWGHPPSLERPAANRPWRTGELQLQLPIPLRLTEYPSWSLWSSGRPTKRLAISSKEAWIRVVALRRYHWSPGPRVQLGQAYALAAHRSYRSSRP